MVSCLERGADCLHMVQLMPLYPKTPSSLASFKSRLGLPFWYRLTQVVLKKRPLNGCSSVVVYCSAAIRIIGTIIRPCTNRIGIVPKVQCCCHHQ